MNANLIFNRPIGLEFLPLEQDLLVVNHPGFYNLPNTKFTYERNPQSTAGIPEGGVHYVMGALNGGKAAPFLAMCEKLSQNIRIDEQNNIIALWHDESHLNRYILDNPNYKILSPAYLYPEGWQLPFEPKVIILEKSRFFDVHKFKTAQPTPKNNTSKKWWQFFKK